MSNADFLPTLFNEIDSNSTITNMDEFTADDNFALTLRTKMEKAEEGWTVSCNSWVEKFSNQTNTKWKARCSKASVQKIDFRKVYICKHKDCKSRVDIKVKKVTKHTVKKDKLLKAGYNAEIKVVFNHSHVR